MASITVTLAAEVLRDESGRVRVMRAYLKERPDATVSMCGLAYPDDADAE